METKLQYFDRNMHNKNILEYAQILVTDGRFIIFDIEGRSNRILSLFVGMVCRVSI